MCKDSDFPNGDNTINNLDYNHDVSWGTDTYSSNTTKNGTNFNWGKEKKNLPITLSCMLHPEHDFVHIKYNERIIMVYPHYQKEVLIQHLGIHNHPKPPKITPSAIAIKEFITLFQLWRKSRPSFGEIDDSLCNLGRVCYHALWIRTKGKGKSELGIFASIDKMASNELIVSSDLDNCVGHIALQTPGMKQIIVDQANALQTDTIMG